MPTKIKIGQLADTVIRELDDFAVVAEEALHTAVDAAAREAVKELKRTSPRRTGKYAAAWKSKKETSGRLSYGKAVYNENGYLSHLLENGHALRRGGRSIGKGRVPPKPHIAPAEQTALRVLTDKLKEGIVK